MPLHGSEEIPACTLEIGLRVETAAYEENRIHSVALDPMRDTLHIDAAARYGKGSSNTVDWPTSFYSAIPRWRERSSTLGTG